MNASTTSDTAAPLAEAYRVTARLDVARILNRRIQEPEAVGQVPNVPAAESRHASTGSQLPHGDRELPGACPLCLQLRADLPPSRRQCICPECERRLFVELPDLVRSADPFGTASRYHEPT